LSINIIWTFAVALLTYIGFRLFKRIISRIARKKEVPSERVFYIQKVFEVLFALTGLVAIAFIWSVDFEGFSVFASSFFAIVGVALFAQWSILSNVTASIIIFFNFPARVGDTIRIVDGDNSVEGKIKEISLFQIELNDHDGNLVIYPNNLLLQKPVVRIS
jgi:small-conductance mechanosensitive channel